MPRSARPRYTSAYHAGTEPARRSDSTASGEPFTSERYELPPEERSVTWAMVDMRCSADEKWWR
eukprot:scaffold2805_cov215-Isochrysis_galbana.AAC.4